MSGSPLGALAAVVLLVGSASGEGLEIVGSDRPIEGIVVDEAGRPVAGASVRICRGSKAPVGVTGEDGRFVLRDLGSTEIVDEELIASTPDGRLLATATVPGATDGAPAAPVRMVLRPARAVSVVVRDAAGKPVAGASVEVITDSHPVASGRTDVGGRVELRYPEGSKFRCILALKPGAGFDYFQDFRPWSQEGFLTNPATVSMVLDGASTRRLKVVDSGGKPLAGMEFAVWSIKKRSKPSYATIMAAPGAWARSDRDGVVTFDWLPADAEKAISALLLSSDHGTPLPLIPLPGDGQPMPTVRLVRKVTLHGKVLRPDGRPAPGILVEASGIHRGLYPSVRAYCRTGPDGSYSIRVAPDRSYMVSVCDRSWAAPSRCGIVLEREGGTRDVPDLQLVAGTILRGRVTAGPDDLPVPGANVLLWGYGDPLPPGFDNANGGRERRYCLVKTDSGGRYELRIGPGTYSLNVYGFQTGVPIAPEHEIEIVRDFHSPEVNGVVKHHLRGLVYDPAVGRGEPVAGALVKGYAGPGPSIDGCADRRGRFDLMVLFDPKYLYARNPEGTRAGLGVLKRGEGLGLVKVGPAGRVSGRIVDAMGRPLAGWPVWLRMKGSPGSDAGWFDRRAVTDDGGVYSFDGVILGSPCDLGAPRWLDSERREQPIRRVPFTPTAVDQVLADFVPDPPVPAGDQGHRRAR